MPDQLAGIRTIYFDFDGTLHESNRIYAPAFRRAWNFLVEAGQASAREFTDEAITHWLGYTSIQMWEEFMPRLDAAYRQQAGGIIGRSMVQAITEGEARLYEGAASTLRELTRRGFHLVFLSNCSRLYMETARQTFALNDYFVDMVCAEDFAFISKEAILRQIKDHYPTSQVIIGDRRHDMEAGRGNNIPAIYCEYGYGSAHEGDTAIRRIQDIRQLLELLPRTAGSIE